MNILEKITERTKERIEEEKKIVPLEEVRRQAEEKGIKDQIPAFEQALRADGLSFICEAKKASPSKGLITPDFPYVEIAREYEAGGAAAISCLTEPFWFRGSDAYLKEIVQNVSIPVLRKDFTCDEYMIYQAKAMGASAVLLICSVLEDGRLKAYHQLADELGLSALVETHNEEEILRAQKIGAKIIGVNNRNLKDFTVDIKNSIRLREMVSSETVFVSESGIRGVEDMKALYENGTDAVLIGELLMRKSDRKAALMELVDARVPLSSRNPDIDELGKNKARLILLNKADLAEDRRNDEWMEYFKKQGYSVVKVNSKKGGGIKSIQSVIQEACKEKMERDRKRGILNRPVRAMVVGIPNVGKSTFINALAGKACAKTGNKPGVTKGKQWIRLNKNVELLDTPGILWPKFEDQTVGLRLAFIGSIKDEILQTEELASELVKFLNQSYPGVLEEKYTIESSEDNYEVLRRIAESRHCLVRGSELDVEKAAAILLDDFRNGRLGRLTLELPEEN